MKKICVLISALLLVASSRCADIPKKPLTFLVFMAADNDLADFVEDDLDEMQSVGSNENVNILVYLNSKSSEGNKFSRKLVVQKGHADAWAADKQYDSGDAATVYRACKWAHKHFPADRFVIVFWNHGSGSLNRSLSIDDAAMRSVCYDDTTGHHLTDAHVRTVLDSTVKNLRDGKKIDIVAFDACYMGGIETAFAVKDFANYMVASEETIPGNGYGYDRFLSVVAQGPIDPQQLVQVMVSAYQSEYSRASDYTLSAIDLRLINSVVKKVNSLSEHCITLLRGSKGKQVQTMLLDCAQKAQHFSEATYIDVVDFLELVGKSVKDLKLNAADAKAFSEKIEDASSAIKRAILANVYGNKYPKAHGLSIYFADKLVSTDYSSTYWAQETSWGTLLSAINGATSPLYFIIEWLLQCIRG